MYKIAAFELMSSLFRNRFRYNSLRYAGRDYSLPGKYFITICTAGKKELFGNVIDSKMYLSEIGYIASQVWYEIPVHFPFIGLDAFVVMPDHIHGIIVINRFVETPMVGAMHATPLQPNNAKHLVNETMSSISPKSGSLSVVVRSYKSAVTIHAHKLNNQFSWQPGFYDTIICTTGQLSRIRKYISENTQCCKGKV